jgi:CspA family cold shock protein
MDSEKITGKVKWYNREKGFGLIEGEDGISYSVNHTNLTDTSALYQDEQVNFDVEINDGVRTRKISNVRVIPDTGYRFSRRRIVDPRAYYRLWTDVKDVYPEFQVHIERILYHFSLEFTPPEIAQKLAEIAFPPGDDMPIGAFTKYADQSDEELRRGAFICFTEEDVTIIVHAFYDNPKRETICWRGKVFRNRDQKIIPMPPRENYVGDLLKVSWYENVWEFLGALEEMIDFAKTDQGTLTMDFGHVVKFHPSGYGFIEGMSHTSIFFRIEKIRAEEVRQQLETGFIDDLVVWCKVQQSIKGPKARRVYCSKDEIPFSRLSESEQRLETLWRDITIELPDWLPKLTSNLLGDDGLRRLADERKNILSQYTRKEVYEMRLAQYLEGTGIVGKLDSQGRVLFRHSPVEQRSMITYSRKMDRFLHTRELWLDHAYVIAQVEAYVKENHEKKRKFPHPYHEDFQGLQ